MRPATSNGMRAAIALGAVLALAGSAAAADWPIYDLDPQGTAGQHALDRGPGGYLSGVKIALAWLLLAAWVKTTDWVSQDCSRIGMSYVVWNSVVFGVFFATFVLLLLLLNLNFGVGFTLLALSYIGPLGAYIYFRNKSVEPHRRVLTPDHMRQLMAGRLKQVGVKVDTEKKAAYEKGAPVNLTARGGANEIEDKANLLKSRQSPAYVEVKDLIADVVKQRGDAVMLDYTREAVAVRYEIDGVWHNNEPRERESGDVLLAVVKTLANLDPAERRKKQAGTFGAEYNGTKYTGRLVSQGTQTGERVLLRLDDGKVPFETFEDIGMREKMREQVFELVGASSGFLLFTSLPGGGLTTLIDVALEETDRLMRDFVAVEDVARPEREIQNVEVTTYDVAAGETPATVLPKLIRAYPNVIVVRDLTDAETVGILSEQVAEDRLILGSIRAKEATEALLRVLMLKVPAATFAPAITAVLNQRLVRKLCPACRVAYAPTEDLLKKLGLPAGRVKALYREPKPEEREDEKTCTECLGVGYKGRTAIFELLMVDDKIREVLVKQPKLELLKKAARLGGNRTLQEEGILLVAKGETSLAELMRVLK